ncbi:MAG TPA: hypothetical protein VNM37_28895, partial [Candidatus Dormibacteraeota bacterium]|nr:hypothetical protein [Candidatus Dormibacteraeota bacterium]
MPDPSGINPLVGRVLPAPAGPTFDDALGTQARYEQIQAFRQQRVKAAQDEIAQKEAQAHLGQVLQSSLKKVGDTGLLTYDRDMLMAGLGGAVTPDIQKML